MGYLPYPNTYDFQHTIKTHLAEQRDRDLEIKEKELA